MSEKIDDGDAAFPRTGYSADFGSTLPQAGMSLRDYFAGQALVGILSHGEFDGSEEDYSRWAYAQADAMIKECKK